VDIKQFFKDWAQRGVYMINDVLDDTEKKMSFQKFQETYNIQINFLTYHDVITTMSVYIKKSNIPINDLEKLNGALIQTSLRNL
jgi:uracil DNA glycosylase